MTTIRIHTIDDENVEYYLNDHFIVSANHDSHGWGGMDLARNIVDNFAEALNVTIYYTYDGKEEN